MRFHVTGAVSYHDSNAHSHQPAAAPEGMTASEPSSRDLGSLQHTETVLIHWEAKWAEPQVKIKELRYLLVLFNTDRTLSEDRKKGGKPEHTLDNKFCHGIFLIIIHSLTVFFSVLFFLVTSGVVKKSSMDTKNTVLLIQFKQKKKQTTQKAMLIALAKLE